MAQAYILGIDQSTQGTKGLLFDAEGCLVARSDCSHAQKIDANGWVEHDPEEIVRNTLTVVRQVVEKAGIDKDAIQAVGISNQRETAMAWDSSTGKPLYNAVVWQCARGEAICKQLEAQGWADKVRQSTGLPLSPYFSAAKLAWVLQNVPAAAQAARQGTLRCGTMDSWLVYCLTGGKYFQTDYSNASRTQLFNIRSLEWDAEICNAFGVPVASLAKVSGSDDSYGETDFGGYLSRPIPIHAVMGDSHGALFGQDCRKPGMVKATYGTGSSVMLHTGDAPVWSKSGLSTSLAWGMNGTVSYVLEGNINYTGSVIGWMKSDLGLAETVQEAHTLAAAANPQDKTYFVPAFTGLGAPYWDSEATGLFTGITRMTGRAELVKAGVDCIAYQVADVVSLMKEESGLTLAELRVDGGPTESQYLMQRQSDILGMAVQVPDLQELSGMGAAYAAGIAVGLYDAEQIFSRVNRKRYGREMDPELSERLYDGWKKAVRMALTRE